MLICSKDEYTVEKHKEIFEKEMAYGEKKLKNIILKILSLTKT